MDRREKILAAAWQVLAQTGFEKVTTRRIAEAAGINIATLHYHFGSKEAVLIETLRYAQRWMDRRLREEIAHAKTPSEMLEGAFDVMMQTLRERPGVLRFDLVVRGFRDPEARREAEYIYSRYRRFVEEMLEWHLRIGGRLDDGLTVTDFAQYIVSAVDGVVLHHTLSGDDERAERHLALVRRQIRELMFLAATPEIAPD